jgi:hypothetical protein
MFGPDSTLPTRNPDVVFKELDTGAVLLSTVEEVYYGVNQIGARIWALLPPVTSTFGELCNILTSEHPDADPEQVRRDAQRFLDDIVANRLVSHDLPGSADGQTRTSDG